MAPTLATACAALPPGGAGLAWGGPALRLMAPTLLDSRSALPQGLDLLGVARAAESPWVYALRKRYRLRNMPAVAPQI